jgi:hypothetical protein
VVRTHAVHSESDLRFVADLEREKSGEESVKCGFTSKITQILVLIPFSCSERLGETESLKLRNWIVIFRDLMMDSNRN